MRRRRDPLKYLYKTPSHGVAHHKFYETNTRFYLERRVPVHPNSIERQFKEAQESSFNEKFHVMASKNNDKNPKGEREYFDKPIGFRHQGYGFAPVYTKPHHLASTASRSIEAESPLTPGSPVRKGSTIGSDFALYQTKNPNMLPVTTGLNDMQLAILSPKRKNSLANFNKTITDGGMRMNSPGRSNQKSPLHQNSFTVGNTTSKKPTLALRRELQLHKTHTLGF